MLKRNPWPVILQIVPELQTGGAERSAVEVAEAVRKAGGRALVLSEGGALEGELAEAGGEFLRFPAKTKNPALLLANAFRLRQVIRAYQVSLVHARSRAPAWSACLAARRTKRPFVTTYHGIYRQNGRIKAWYNGVMAKGDAVIANSEFTASVLRERHPGLGDRLHIIARGVDLARFNPAAVSAERIASLRQSWGLGADERIVLLPGRLTRWKGQHLLIEAMARLRECPSLRNVKAVLAGDDQGRADYSSFLREMAEGFGLGGGIILAGHCSDMPAAYRAAALTVIPSIEEEGFGRVSVEAQAMACPVVASCLGALPETLGAAGADMDASAASENGVKRLEAGWLFRSLDGEALARALQAALSAPADSLERMGAIARAHAARNFSKQALQTRTLAVYDRLLGTQLARDFKALAKP